MTRRVKAWAWCWVDGTLSPSFCKTKSDVEHWHRQDTGLGRPRRITITYDDGRKKRKATRTRRG